MTRNERSRIKNLLKETFWQFSDEELTNITPKLVRYWASRNLHPDIIDATAINFGGSGFWHRVEQTCYLYKHLEYLYSICQ